MFYKRGDGVLPRERQRYSRYTKDIKLEAIRRVLEEDQPVQEVIADLGIRHRDNVYEWIKKYNKDGPEAFERNLGKKVKPKENMEVEKEIQILKTEVEALKTYLEQILQCEEEKFKVIESLEGKYPVELLCNALDVSKVEFYEYRERQSVINN